MVCTFYSVVVLECLELIRELLSSVWSADAVLVANKHRNRNLADLIELVEWRLNFIRIRPIVDILLKALRPDDLQPVIALFDRFSLPKERLRLGVLAEFFRRLSANFFHISLPSRAISRVHAQSLHLIVNVVGLVFVSTFFNEARFDSAGSKQDGALQIIVELALVLGQCNDRLCSAL